MLEINQAVLSEMTQAIVREVNPAQIYLFGSYATGHASKDSDLDLMVVEDRPFDHAHSRLKELGRIRKALSSYRICKDILIYSSDEFKKWKNSFNHVIGRCQREGKLLYARH